MERALLETRFARMGARLKVQERVARDRRGGTANVVVDVQRDRKGEFFEIRVRPTVDVRLEVVDVQPSERHLLLLAEEGNRKLKFLCGHDERQWFVAAVPEDPGVATVQTALEALKPVEVQRAQARQKIKTEDRLRRRTTAYIRQGEWFFMPAPDMAVEEWLILHNEPLSRGAGSKAHTAECCYRLGGVTVYVCRRRPNGLDEAAYNSPEQGARSRPAALARGRRSVERGTMESAYTVLEDWEHEGPSDPTGDALLLAEALAVLQQYGDKPEDRMSWEAFEAELDRAEAAGELAD